MKGFFCRINGVDTSVSSDGVLLEWDGVRVGIARDVWDGLRGAWFERVDGIKEQVVSRGLSGDLTVLGGKGEENAN